MKKVILIITAFGLASCDGVHDLQDNERQTPRTLAASGQPRTPGALTVITTKTVPEYDRDLEHCENRVSSRMGMPGNDDSTEALKRALKEHPGQKTISLSYINQDKAILRQNAIRSCLSRLGYLVQD